MTTVINQRTLRNASIATLALLTSVCSLTGCGAASEPTDEYVNRTSLELTMSKFKGWTPLTGGGVLTSAPSAVSRGPGEVDIVARGTDSQLYYNFGQLSGTTFTWFPWSVVGTPVASGIVGKGSITSFSTGTGTLSLAVAVRANVGSQIQAFVKVSTPPGGFGAWAQVSNGNLENDPAVVGSGPNLFIFAPGTDHHYYFSKNYVSGGYNASNWGGWIQIPGGVLTSEPGVAERSGVLYVSGRATDNKYWYTTSSNAGASWTAWTQIPSTVTFSSGPALTVSPSNSQLNIFGTETVNAAMWNSTSTNGGAAWSTFLSTGGKLVGGPAATSPASGTIYTFGTATDKNAWSNLYQE